VAHYGEADVERAAEQLQQHRQRDVQGALRKKIEMTKGPNHVT